MSGLRVRGVTKRYGERAVVSELSLAVEPGTVASLVGPNGCGKTTTLGMIAGIKTPDEGRINVSGYDTNDIAPGAQDEDIPDICRGQEANALVSANVRDFGARRVIFEALLEAGVSVIVPRPSRRATLTPNVQMAMLIRHIPSIASALRDNQGPVVLKVIEGGVTEITLEQLSREVA